MSERESFIIAGHQPHYLPWIGYVSKIDQADIFCLVDTVQFEKKNFQNRNSIRTHTGSMMLTVPVKTHEKFDQLICDVEIDNRIPWRRKHWKTIQIAYQHAPYFAQYSDFFADVYDREWNRLVDLNEYMLRGILKFLGIQKEMIKSSSFMPTGKKTDLLIDICKKTGASGYLSGTGGAKGYVDETKFLEHGLTHQFQRFHHPVYPQIHGEFMPKLAIIDLLFNCGPESGAIVRGAKN